MTSPDAPTQQALLGFDAREMWLDVGQIWGASRRRQYLLREDVRKPLAVDTMVWPSLFGEGLPEFEREALGLNDVDPPAWRGPNQNLWQDLQKMRTYLASLKGATEKARWIIGVSWFSDDGVSKQSTSGGPYLLDSLPSTPAADWKLLGFDIADSGFVSGLSNCGYLDAERVEARKRWGYHLNEFHLIDDLKHAFAFRDFSNQRVPEHAPFFVYGVWLLPPASGSTQAQFGGIQ